MEHHTCKCHRKCQVTGLDEYEKTHFAKAMVLTCIDYRFIDIVITFLENDPVLSFSYDLTTLGGASLGFNQTKFKSWRVTFLDLLQLAIDLHHIEQVIVFDHMDCGAYQLLYPDLELNTEAERLLHVKNIKRFVCKLKKSYPKLEYKGYLSHVDGRIENIL